jgi:hypothetical protein
MAFLSDERKSHRAISVNRIHPVETKKREMMTWGVLFEKRRKKMRKHTHRQA